MVAAKLTWEPPLLVTPEVINVTNANRDLRLDVRKDYRLVIAEKITGPVIIGGGRNRVLIGGEIATQNLPADNDRRPLYLKGSTGVTFIEGVKLGGDNAADMINIDERLGATVILQNILTGFATGTAGGNHADVLQSWGGPYRLLIDGLQGFTTYQGFFVIPHQYDGTLALGEWDWRNVDLRSTASSGYQFWKQDDLTIKLTNVNGWRVGGANNEAKMAWPSMAAWPGLTNVEAQSPVLRGTPGMNYVSPGYGVVVDPPPVDPPVVVVPPPTTTIGPKLQARLTKWIEGEMFELASVVYRDTPSDVVDHADVLWPDGSTGKLELQSYITIDYANLITGFKITHDRTGTVVTQPVKVYSTVGLLEHKPPLRFNDSDVLYFLGYGEGLYGEGLYGGGRYHQPVSGGFGSMPFGAGPFGQ